MAKKPKKHKYGEDPHKLHRRDAVDTSVEAAHGIPTARWERKVHDAIKAAGDHGCTQDELLAMFPDQSYSTISARLPGLRYRGLIHRNGQKRKGKSGRLQAVNVAGPAPKEQNDARAPQG